MGRLHRPWSGVDLKEAQKVIRQVARSQVDCMSQVIPWFLGTMPVSVCIYCAYLLVYFGASV